MQTESFNNKTVDLRITANTCWIVGAGASYDAMGTVDEYGEIETCLPLAFQLMKDVPQNLLDCLLKLQSAFPFDTKDQPFESILQYQIGPVMDWLRSAVAQEQSEVAELGHRCLRGLVEFISRSLLLKEVTSRLTPGSPNGFQYRAGNYLWLASKAYWMKEWSIVSLNYDLLLDRAFREISQYDTSESQFDAWCELIESYYAKADFSPSHEGIYLKIHGTLDAFECLNVDCAKYRRPFQSVQKTAYQILKRGSADDIFELKQRTHFVDHLGVEPPLCESCGTKSYELILPPGTNKTPSESDYYNMLFRRAGSALQRADTWILLGYSCPDYDADTIGLLRDSLRNKKSTQFGDLVIWVIAPDAQEIAKRLSGQLAYPIGFANQTFTEFVNTVLAMTHSQRPSF